MEYMGGRKLYRGIKFHSNPCHDMFKVIVKQGGKWVYQGLFKGRTVEECYKNYVNWQRKQEATV